MNTTLEFRNGRARLILKPDDEWEQRLLGAITKGSGNIEASVKYKPYGHFSNQRSEVIEILLTALPRLNDLQDKEQ